VAGGAAQIESFSHRSGIGSNPIDISRLSVEHRRGSAIVASIALLYASTFSWNVALNASTTAGLSAQQCRASNRVGAASGAISH